MTIQDKWVEAHGVNIPVPKCPPLRTDDSGMVDWPLEYTLATELDLVRGILKATIEESAPDAAERVVAALAALRKAAGCRGCSLEGCAESKIADYQEALDVEVRENEELRALVTRLEDQVLSLSEELEDTIDAGNPHCMDEVTTDESS